MALVPEQILKQTDWSAEFRRTVDYARALLGSAASLSDAEDLAAESFGIFFDPEYSDWAPNEPSLHKKLGSIVNGVLRNRRRHKPTTDEIATDFTATAFAGAVASQCSGPEERAQNMSEAARALVLMQHEIKGEEHAESVFLLECDDISEPQEQADALGLSIGIIYKARHRLRSARLAVKQRMQSEA